MIRRTMSLTAAAGTAAAVIAMAGPASAAPTAGAPGPIGYAVVPAPGCQILQEIQVQAGGHEYMRWETNPSSPACSVSLSDNGVTKANWTIPDSRHYVSIWYYDGPGHSEQICATSIARTKPVTGCGPLN